jgi:membrane protease YdiL (CAAX protease family)
MNVRSPHPAFAASSSARIAGASGYLGAAWFIGLCLALAGVAALASASAPALVPFALAIGPAVIGGVLAWREGGAALGRLRRSLTLRPADPRWYLVVLLPIVWAFAVVAAAVALGEPTAGLFATLGPTALIVPLVVLIPAFAEELGWRGYAVPRLLTVMSPLSASLVLAVPWTVMHLVLMLPGGMNEGAALWPSVLSLFAYSVVLTWVFVGTGGSVLLTALLHTGLNGVVPLMAGVDADLSWALRAVVAAAIALAVIALGGFRRSGVERPAATQQPVALS